MQQQEDSECMRWTRLMWSGWFSTALWCKQLRWSTRRADAILCIRGMASSVYFGFSRRGSSRPKRQDPNKQAGGRLYVSVLELRRVCQNSRGTKQVWDKENILGANRVSTNSETWGNAKVQPWTGTENNGDEIWCKWPRQSIRALELSETIKTQGRQRCSHVLRRSLIPIHWNTPRQSEQIPTRWRCTAICTHIKILEHTRAIWTHANTLET